MRRGLKALRLYGAALALVAVTTAVILPFGSANFPTLLPAFLLAVIASSLFFGLGPGILASALAAISIDFFFTAPFYRLFPITPPEGMRVLTYVLLTTVINALVTARKRAELRLIKERVDREVAEGSDRLKGSIVANISTAIRTPVQEIVRQSARLEAECDATAAPVQAAAAIRQQGAELARLMNELSDLARVASGTLEVSLAPFTLPTLVRGVVASFAALARERGINLELVVDGPIPITVASDANKLRSILENVIRNAMDFTRAGFVRVTLRLDDNQPDPTLNFIVHDSGVGIPYEQMSHIFEPFVQVGTTPYQRAGGAGLGLAWSRLLARKLGGDVRLIRTTSGVGSTFEVTVGAGQLDDVEMVRIVGAAQDEQSSIVPYSRRTRRPGYWTPANNTGG